MNLKKRLASKEAVAGVIGLGYVGLPLAVELARNHVRTIGFDVDVRKVSELAAGRSYIPDVPSDHVAHAVNTGMLTPTTDPASLAEADVIDICVPTPLRKTKDPDLSYVVKAVETTAAVLRKGQLVILESTTYPGTTDEVVKPALEAKGLKAGVDFYLAFSPNGSTRETRRTRPRTFRRSSVATMRQAPKLRRSSTSWWSTRSCRSARLAPPRW